MAKFTLEGIINSPQFDIRNSNIRPGDLSSAAATLAYRQRLEEIKRVAGDKSKYKAIVVGYKGGVNPNAPYLYAAMGNTSYAETLFERQARHSPAPPDWLTNTMQMMAGYGSEPDYTDPELISDAIGDGRVLKEAVMQARNINSITLKIYVFGLDEDRPIPVFDNNNLVRELEVYRDCELFTEKANLLEAPPVGSLILVEFTDDFGNDATPGRGPQGNAIVESIISDDRTFARAVLQSLTVAPDEASLVNLRNASANKINALRERGWWDEIEGDTVPAFALCDYQEEIDILNRDFITKCNSEYSNITSNLQSEKYRDPGDWATMPNTGFKGIFPLQTDSGDSLLNTAMRTRGIIPIFGRGFASMQTAPGETPGEHSGVDISFIDDVMFGSEQVASVTNSILAGYIVNSNGDYLHREKIKSFTGGYADIPIRAIADGTVRVVQADFDRLHIVQLLGGGRLKGPNWTGGTDPGGAIRNEPNGFKLYWDADAAKEAGDLFGWDGTAKGATVSQAYSWWQANPSALTGDLATFVTKYGDGRVPSGQTHLRNAPRNEITIDHGKYDCLTYISSYGHLAYKPEVSEGDRVKKGDIIGYMGQSGAMGIHLHYDVSMQTLDIVEQLFGASDELDETQKNQRLTARNALHLIGDWNGANEYDTSWFSEIENYVNSDPTTTEATEGSLTRALMQSNLRELYSSLITGDTTGRIMNQVSAGSHKLNEIYSAFKEAGRYPSPRSRLSEKLDLPDNSSGNSTVIGLESILDLIASSNTGNTTLSFISTPNSSKDQILKNIYTKIGNRTLYQASLGEFGTVTREEPEIHHYDPEILIETDLSGLSGSYE